jgi:hypothetical protein
VTVNLYNLEAMSSRRRRDVPAHGIFRPPFHFGSRPPLRLRVVERSCHRDGGCGRR